MIVIDNKLISDDVIEKQFVCDLSKCKGGCCEDGDAGAPLEEAELKLVNEYYEVVKPYLTQPAIKEIEKKGNYEYDEEFGWVTPTLPSDNEICVYAYREPDGLIKCAFEQAYNEGKIPWKKPISCHLYPIIAYKGKHGDYERLNYEPRKKMCSPACKLGKSLQVPVYKFLKEPLTRKYGQEFYAVLDQIATRNDDNPAE
ncbi:DUF3109 family protein [Niabella drilacis]|uniref:DUF3109 family protein n=1 Tax=Niabella drilacis (strain DSM 25811 / CCM 8410 / CCUG 62505 / LMG 26954 / E90) TaxID=1285928 RepID=A0A1G6PXR2_NIADE|nr:DUF3109 family protein [Niabella drilacis]SDC84454.1 Protein of unknown function [Niabella drilacis]